MASALSRLRCRPFLVVVKPAQNWSSDEASGLCRTIAGWRLAIIERSPHGTPTWRPEAFRRAILDFLGDVEAGRPVAGSLRY